MLRFKELITRLVRWAGYCSQPHVGTRARDSLRYGLLLCLLGASRGILMADEDPKNVTNSRRLTIHVQISGALLKELSDERLVAARDVFLYVPSLRRLRETQDGFLWIKAQIDTSEPIQHRFSIKDNVLVPTASVARVGDTLQRTTLGGLDVSYTAFNLPPAGSSSAGLPQVRFSEPEPYPVEISVAASTPPIPPAFLLVSDNSFAKVTDKRGVAQFESWPKHCELPMYVRCPSIASEVTYESDSLKISSAGKFVVSANPEDQEHNIRILLSRIAK